MPNPKNRSEGLGKRIAGWLLDHLLGSLVGTFITAGVVVRAVPALRDFWVSLPGWIQAAIVLAVVAGLVAAWRFDDLRRRDAALFTINVPPHQWGYGEIGQCHHGGVDWTVEHPRLPHWGAYHTEEDEVRSWARSAVVYERPVCPSCAVTLSQRRRFWGDGYIWKCPGCDFTLKSRLSWTASAAAAQEAFRAQLTEELAKAHPE